VVELAKGRTTEGPRLWSRWGNARPLPKVPSRKDALTFVSPKEKKNGPTIWSSEGTPRWKMLSGTTTGQMELPWRGPARERQL